METGVSRDFQLAPPSRTHKTGETGMPAPGRSRFHGISTSLTLDFDRKLKLTDDFPSAGTPFSWARESRLFVVPFSRPKGRTERCCLPSLILSAAQNPLPLLLIYRATSRGSAGGDGTPRGAPPAFSVDEGGRPSRRWGRPSRGGGQRQGTGRDSRILSAPAAVPARRGGRSGATASPFRRNGITVPARRHHRSGATRKASRTESKLRRAAKGYANASPSRFARSARHPAGEQISSFLSKGRGGSPLPPARCRLFAPREMRCFCMKTASHRRKWTVLSLSFLSAYSGREKSFQSSGATAVPSGRT